MSPQALIAGGGGLLPAVGVGADGARLRGLSSAGQAAPAHGQESTQQHHTAVVEPGTAGTRSQELMLIHFLPWNKVNCRVSRG